MSKKETAPITAKEKLLKDCINELQKIYAAHSAYLWGGSGQIIGKTTIDEIIAAEKTSDDPLVNARRVLVFVGKLIEKGYNLDKAQFFDCSGLVIYVLEKFGLYIGDNTANGLYDLGEKISVSNAKAGDLAFLGTPTHKHHVGFVIGDGKVIECKGRDKGVVTSSLESWEYAAHYTWFDDLKLTRKLKVANTPMTGADVLNVQRALCSHGFSCACNGSYTTNTEAAVKRYQKAAKLAVVSYGVVAKKTAESLGITWAKK